MQLNSQSQYTLHGISLGKISAVTSLWVHKIIVFTVVKKKKINGGKNKFNIRKMCPAKIVT